MFAFLISLFCIWLLSFTGTYTAILALKKFSVLDTPNERSNHKTVTPRGGGIALVGAILLGWGICDVPLQIVLAALLLAVISFIDDMRGLPVGARLIAQILAVATALPALYVPGDIVVLIALGLFWVWFMNITNFMDGIDEITSMQMVMMAIGICLVISGSPQINRDIAVWASLLAASVMGFFWFNRHPARIFMGDVGSVTLGFLMFFLLTALALSGAYFSALILPAYYLTDSGLTFFKRLLRGEKVWQAHSEHTYQKAVRSGMSHDKVVRRISVLNAALIILAMLATINVMAGCIAFLTAYMLTLLFIRKGLLGKH